MGWSRKTVVVSIGLAVIVVAALVTVVLRRSSTEPAGQPATPPPTSTAAGANPTASASASPGWVGTWAAAVQRGETSFRQQTLRQIVHTSIGGDAVRVRLSNQYGSAPLTVRNVRVARHIGGGRIDTGTDRPLTFGGGDSASVPPGSSVTSDPVDFDVPAGGDLAISFHLPADTGQATQHVLANRTNYVAAGDQSGARGITTYSFLAGVDVRNTSAKGAVVALGASITDGFDSSFDRNTRWPDLLAGRLRDAGRTVGVLNAGISGNELTRNGASESALQRFDRDVLAQPGVRWVIFSDDALNDLGDSDPPSTADLTAAMRQLSDRAHAAGIKFYCSTLTPYEGADYWSEQGAKGRAAINEFIRGGSSGCDAVIDQDAATHDPAAPDRYRAEFDSGDHLHPNDQGMRAIAEAVDLGLFQ